MPVLGCRRAQRPLGEVAGLPVAGAICGQSRGSDDTGIRAGHRCADKRQVRFAGSRLHLGALKLAAKSGVASCPLSSAHYFETHEQAD
jgi:hypothetical protein